MPAQSIKRILPLLQNRGCLYVLDYGAGTFRNSRYLLGKGFRVISVDKPGVISRFAGAIPGTELILSVVSNSAFSGWNTRFDAIVCTFVLNLLDWATNTRLAEEFAQKMQAGGIVLVEAKEQRKEPVKNALTLAQMDRLFLSRGFYRLYYFRGRLSIGAIYEKL